MNDKDQRVSANDNAAQEMTGSPSLAVFNNKLYGAFQGAGSSGEIRYATCGGKTWSSNTRIGTYGMTASPAMAVYKGKLYLAHQGYNASGEIWYTTFDGVSWSPDTKIRDFGMTDSPALAVFNGKLYLAHQGYNACGQLRYTTFDGANWSDDTNQHAAMSNSPSLAEFHGKLYRAEQGYGADGSLRWKSEAFGQINIPVPLLDVWGEGRIVTDDGFVTGFYEALNLNKIGQNVSNGTDSGQEIPSFCPG